MNNKNYGFKPPVMVPEDFWLGSGKLGSVDLNPQGDWRPYLPQLEHQRKKIETQACVSFGTLSALEMIHKLLYFVEPNYSDRFIAKMSETDPNGGNTPKKVSETIKHAGTIPEMDYPFADSLGEYYQDVPSTLKYLGKVWLGKYGFGYEWVAKDKLKEALPRSPVGCAVNAWNQNEKGEYIRLGSSNHWCVLVAYDEADRPVIWDSYDEGLKTLEKDYELDFPQMYVLKKKEIAQGKKKESIATAIIAALAKWLNDIFK